MKLLKFCLKFFGTMLVIGGMMLLLGLAGSFDLAIAEGTEVESLKMLFESIGSLAIMIVGIFAILIGGNESESRK